MENSKDLKQNSDKFVSLMNEMVYRWVIFEEFENNLDGKDISIEENLFVRFFVYEYHYSQLRDIRKFFDTTDGSYHFNDGVLKPLKNDLIIEEFLKFQQRWENPNNSLSLKKIANKLVIHQDKKMYSRVEIEPNLIRDFISDLNKFIEKIFLELNKNGVETGIDQFTGKKIENLKLRSKNNLDELINTLKHV